ncbi:HNH endonuclease [Massilia sp. YIM B02443]|uniref:HNH endonuclease n=1 Tax=Massilia sp. YIM B02443 TaxID=3050127 RepID=UPI0025B68A33|nr:HNH endonuclease [Massilia sp. YIM B02443]MDN4038819.1 HNH endonuclease [Massilia sp. YIM B02443]
MSESTQESLVLGSRDWTDEEFNGAIQAYLNMLRAELNGEPYNKAEINRQLRAGPLPTRSKGSIEFRMRNISAALYELRMPWIAGYLPANNIGSTAKEKIVDLLRANDIAFLELYVPTADRQELDNKASALRKQAPEVRPIGSFQPIMVSKITTSYVRDPAVKAWVLQAAGGKCEGCDTAAPFIASDGFPYLEVHHVMPLSSHGSDTTTNAVALCPNCHRRCHSSIDRDEFKLSLYQKISRLIVEAPAMD